MLQRYGSAGLNLKQATNKEYTQNKQEKGINVPMTNPLPIDTYRNKILPLRAQLAVRNRWLQERLDTLLPELMQRAGLEMWLVVAREYNEDPVIMTLLPEPSMAARRRTILVFSRQPDGTVERLTLDRYGFGDFYQKGWDPATEDQFACLGRVVRERNPQTIGLNVADEFPFGDGLTHSEHGRVLAALGAEYATRVRSAEALCVGWLERRIEAELTVYPRPGRNGPRADWGSFFYSHHPTGHYHYRRRSLVVSAKDARSGATGLVPAHGGDSGAGCGFCWASRRRGSTAAHAHSTRRPAAL